MCLNFISEAFLCISQMVISNTVYTLANWKHQYHRPQGVGVQHFGYVVVFIAILFFFYVNVVDSNESVFKIDFFSVFRFLDLPPQTIGVKKIEWNRIIYRCRKKKKRQISQIGECVLFTYFNHDNLKFLRGRNAIDWM